MVPTVVIVPILCVIFASVVRSNTGSNYTVKEVKQCKYWVVITTIFNPTAVMKQFTSEVDWCLCIVGDRKSPTNWDMEGFGTRLVYLSAADQEILPYKIAKLLPWNHFGRKNIGYLFAMQNGAQLIYDTDDDNLLKFGFVPLLPNVYLNSKYTEACATSHLYNPYPEFGSIDDTGEPVFTWPRGFPLNWINDKRTRCYEGEKSNYNHKVGSKGFHSGAISVFQSLADNDPDVDSIYRMTGKIPFSFKKSSVQVALPHGMMSPLNAQATIFKAEAFWGLLLPITVHGRVSDIWRSYILQRVLWETGFHVGFISPIVTQCRNSHDYLIDYFAERPLFENAGDFVQELLKQDSHDLNDIPSFLKQVVVALSARNFILKEDVELINAWIEDLRSINYNFPPISTRYKHVEITNKIEHLINSTCEETVLNSISEPMGTLSSPRVCYLINDRAQYYDCSSIFDWKYYANSINTVFNTETEAWEHWNKIGIQKGYRVHAGKRILKIVMMTKDEWPLLKYWVIYHGEIFGFKNLYIVDASDDLDCINFLKQARERWGLNVVFSQSNLNVVEFELDHIFHSLKASADFFNENGY